MKRRLAGPNLFSDPLPPPFDPGEVPDEYLCSHGVQMRVESVTSSGDEYRLWLRSDHKFEEEDEKGRTVTRKCWERRSLLRATL